MEDIEVLDIINILFELGPREVVDSYYGSVMLENNIGCGNNKGWMIMKNKGKWFSTVLNKTNS